MTTQSSENQHSDEPASKNDAATMAATADPSENLPSKQKLIRDAIVFQVKLVIDGFRDLVLIPVSLIATVLSLLKSGDKAGSEFYDVVAFGKQTDEKINLFGAAIDDGNPDDLPPGDVDQVIAEVEAFVSRELQGERFSQARQRVGEAMSTLKSQFDKTPRD